MTESTFESERGREALEAHELHLALGDIADFAVLTSGGHSHPTFLPPPPRELVGFYRSQDELVKSWAEEVEADVNDGPDGMIRATAAFIDDPLQINANMTLGMQRMHGRWDGDAELKSQAGDIVQVLQVAGYTDAHVVHRNSLQAKVRLAIVPGTTGQPNYIACRRDRLWIKGENPELPPDDPRRILEIDKTSWFAMHIPSLAEVEASAAQKEVWLIIICTALLQDIRLDWVGIRKAIVERQVSLTELVNYLPDDVTIEEAGTFVTALKRANRYGIPDNLIMTRLFDTKFLMRLWSPASRMYVERFIAGANRSPHYATPQMTARPSGLLVPAETIYYLSGRRPAAGNAPIICDNNGLIWPETASNTEA